GGEGVRLEAQLFRGVPAPGRATGGTQRSEEPSARNRSGYRRDPRDAWSGGGRISALHLRRPRQGRAKGERAGAGPDQGRAEDEAATVGGSGGRRGAATRGAHGWRRGDTGTIPPGSGAERQSARD